MSEKNPEADIGLRCFNVAEVPQADLERLVGQTVSEPLVCRATADELDKASHYSPGPPSPSVSRSE